MGLNCTEQASEESFDMAYNTTYGYGGGAFGSQIPQIGVPKPAEDLAALYPNLSATNAKLSGNISSELSGNLPPDVLNHIKDQSAAWGVSSGVPNSGIEGNRSLRDLGLSSLDLMHQGVGDYSSILPTISQTQTVRPELQAEIAATNAQNSAAPNPAAAASYAMGLFNKYLNPSGGFGSQPQSYFTPAGSNTKMPYSSAFA